MVRGLNRFYGSNPCTMYNQVGLKPASQCSATKRQIGNCVHMKRVYVFYTYMKASFISADQTARADLCITCPYCIYLTHYVRTLQKWACIFRIFHDAVVLLDSS